MKGKRAQRSAKEIGELKAAGVRAILDDSDKSPGWKFAEHEMNGVPLRRAGGGA